MADTYNFNYEYFIRRDFFQNFLDEKDEAMQSLDGITVNSENIRNNDKEKYHRINSNVIIVSNITESVRCFRFFYFMICILCK